MLCFVLALALSAPSDPPANMPEKAPVPVGEKAPAKPADPSAELKAVTDKLDALEKSLKSINDQQTKLLQLTAESLQKDLNELTERVRKLESRLDSTRQPPSVSAKPAETTTATVLLVNTRTDIPFEALVNGTTFVVPPSQSRTISVPAGPLGLELVTTNEPARTRTLAAGATHVVTLK
jgi:cell division protein ZapA (FtsZ GTPase activity inhibitor)